MAIEIDLNDGIKNQTFQKGHFIIFVISQLKRGHVAARLSEYNIATDMIITPFNKSTLQVNQYFSKKQLKLHPFCCFFLYGW